MSATVFWLLMSVALFAFEFATPGNLISIWFALSSLLSAAVSVFAKDAFYLQTVIFVLLGFVIMFILRKTLIEKMQKTIIPTNTDILIGKKIRLCEPFGDDGFAKSNIRGVLWTVGYYGPNIEEKEEYDVIAIEGNRIIVK